MVELPGKGKIDPLEESKRRLSVFGREAKGEHFPSRRYINARLANSFAEDESTSLSFLPQMQDIVKPSEASSLNSFTPSGMSFVALSRGHICAGRHDGKVSWLDLKLAIILLPSTNDPSVAALYKSCPNRD